MWQIQKSDPSSTSPNQQSPTQPIIQSYTWKYGIVKISTKQTNPLTNLRQNDILILTQPFSLQPQYQTNDRIIKVQSNQQNKCLDTVDWICKMMLEKGVNRESTVYIQGGGLLLDMAGFASSIFMRGVKKVVYIPTTLLAIVDATVGGKNGINWCGAKNMLGVTRHAHQIIVSLHFLQFLSDRQFISGLAEVIKMATTHDEKLFQMLESDQVTLQNLRSNKNMLKEIVKRSLEIKMKVVEADQFDRNQRKWLNFGHTIGHALEMSEDGAGLKHGQCVGLGILQELKLGELLGKTKLKSIRKRVQKLLKKFNLPTKLPIDINNKELIKLMAVDKKNINSSGVELTLVHKIGKRDQKTTHVSNLKLMEHFYKSVKVQLKEGTNKEQIKQQIEATNKKWLIERRFPSSKSLSIRYLFLSALSFLKNREKIIINNFLQCEDTACMIDSLKALGFKIELNEASRQLEISSYNEVTNGQLNVGNSGLTARFILPLCAHLKGQWIVTCHQRMSERPNKEIFNFCSNYYDCQFEWTSGKENCFPVKITTKGLKKQSLLKPIQLMSQQSSQFISSVLLNSYLWGIRKLQIRVPSGKLVSQSYILMTIDCLNNFGGSIFIPKPKKNEKVDFGRILVSYFSLFNISEVNIEQDLSSYSYPYALGLIHGCNLLYPPLQSLQGDKKFYQYCQQLLSSQLPHNLQFSQCTDTFMTMAAILATNENNRLKIAHREIQIHGIANQRVKESNRIKAIRQNLAKIGYQVRQTEDGLIFPVEGLKYRKFQKKEVVVFETHGDHRLAMSLAILCTYLSMNKEIREAEVKFIIDDKDAVRKTFPSFWQYLNEAGIKLSYEPSLPPRQSPKIFPSPLTKITRTLLMGNRGSGKTTIARILCTQMKDTLLVDIDQQITKKIVEEYAPLKSIAQFVDNKGWEEFRKLERELVEKYGYSDYMEKNVIGGKEKNVLISLGGGVSDWPGSIDLLSKNRKDSIKIYLQKKLQDLQIILNDKRPYIPDFPAIYTRRSHQYQQIADSIITIPSQKQIKNQYSYNKINQYVLSEYRRILAHYGNNNKQNENILRQGYIYCVPRIYGASGQVLNWQDQEQFQNEDILQQMAGIEIRLDAILQQLIQVDSSLSTRSEEERMKRLRYAVADFKLANHQIIKNSAIITTLRTQQQYGFFTQDKPAYHRLLKSIHKIPTSYIDYQYNYLPTNSNSTSPLSSIPAKYIYSYHGHQLTTINNLLALHKKIAQNNQQHLTKLCYKGPQHFWDRFSQKWNKNTNICVNLTNPVTRLHNKYKMVVREADRSGVIGIPNRRELGMINRLAKFFK